LIAAFESGCGGVGTTAGGPTGPSSPPTNLTILSQTAGDSSTAYRDHPDPSICVGPGYVMEFNGLDVILRTKSAMGAIVSTSTQVNFWANVVSRTGGGGFTVGDVIGDPSCYYDPLSQRWFLVENDGGTNNAGTGLWIAVSASSDPTGVWRGFLDIPPQINDLEPFVGADKNGFYVCGIDSTGSIPTASQFCDAFPIADMEWSGAAYPATTHRNRLRGFQQASRPVIDTNPNKSASDPFVIAARSGPAQNCASASCTWGWLVSLGQWSGATASIVGAHNQALNSSMTWYTPPAAGVLEPGGNYVKVRESHTCGSAYASAASSSFYIACGEGVSPTHMGIFWAQINPSTLSVMQGGMISPVDSSGNAIDAIFPSLAIDGNDNVVITYTGVSSTVYPSTYTTAQYPGDGLGTFRTPAQIYAGATSYTADNPAGWGVYGSTAVDPSDGTVWGYNQVGLSSSEWATGIVHFSMPAP